MVTPTTTRTRIGAESIYIQKAEKFLEGAKLTLDKGNWNSAAVLAVHTTISSCDAICAKFLQKKHSGGEHLQAAYLLRELPFPDKTELENKVKQARRVLDIKNFAEYEDKFVKEADAREAVQSAERLFDWVKEKLR